MNSATGFKRDMKFSNVPLPNLASIARERTGIEIVIGRWKNAASKKKRNGNSNSSKAVSLGNELCEIGELGSAMPSRNELARKTAQIAMMATEDGFIWV